MSDNHGHSNGDGDLKRELERWESTTLKKALARGAERKAEFATTSTETRRLYTSLDVAGDDFDRDVGQPGEFPYTRGVQPTMYRGRLWTMRQYAGFGTATESNERFRFLLGQGQTGLSVAFDLPTQIGMDSDDPNAQAEIGQVGVAIDSLADMEDMFSGIPLDRVSTSMTINAPASVLVAMYMVVAEKQGVPSGEIMGTAQNDVLKEYVARGTYIYPPRPSLRLAADLITYCARYAPKFNSISVSGYHIRDAGATAAQEIGFAFANAIEYIEACTRSGVGIDDVAGRISWIFNTHNNFFEEVAKYRALRRMWAKLLRDRFGAKDAASWKLRTHIQTGGATLTAQQPENNVVRAALQALASVLGGTQSMALSCYDEALALPTEEAQRIALRTQQIIAFESGVTDTVDPFGGSYYVEALTDEIERKAQEYIDRVEDMGGAVAAIEAGYVQAEIQEAAVAQQQAIESGERVVVGVNRFKSSEEPEPTIFRVDTEIARGQIERLRRVRAERDGGAAQASLRRLNEAARGEDNLMPAILEAVRAYATLGEICGELRTTWGEYRPPTVV
ncbi:MAG TPA: methylmalonyl-CoA mutase family protein [Dehalococcoidia bacterium]|jgi:methylmalonyl-CoA mutase N-terminal domain/subunit|nr:methylmalonyl-CoA mutase family protein [Dehalococcoidia bacterium]